MIYLLEKFIKTRAFLHRTSNWRSVKGTKKAIKELKEFVGGR